MIKLDIGKKIKEFRKEKKWSQQKLAEKAGVAYNVITRLEQGLSKEPTIQTVMKIARSLKIGVDDLLKESVIKRSERKRNEK